MRRRLTALVACACALGCRGEAPIADQEILLRVTPNTTEVELGQPLSLTVVRVWQRDLAPDDWSEQALAPLVTRLVSTARREDEHHVEETRRYEAQAFSLADVAVPALEFAARPRGGGPERVASSEPFTLHVTPSVARDAPGAPEVPDLLEEPFRWRRFALRAALAIAALAILAWLVRHRRRAPEAEPAPPPTPTITAQMRALARLERLRAQPAEGGAALEAYYVEASALVRDYLEEQFAVRAPEMTTQEFLAAREATSALAAPQRALLADLLAHCDLVKFACLVPDAVERERVLEAAHRFLIETPRAMAS
jgi:hypothetical protein